MIEILATMLMGAAILLCFVVLVGLALAVSLEIIQQIAELRRRR